MDAQTLRKVQLTLLEILKDIDCVCKKHGIQYFLDSGTLLGAVRHQGFIPWDDDLDIGMLRDDYEKFCAIAQDELGDKYFWQTWDTDPDYPIPFGKVRKRGTLYVEAKSRQLNENGFYVDVLPYDFAPNNEVLRKKLKRKQWFLYRTLLMKSGYKPWNESQGRNLKKRVGYIPYRVTSLFLTRRRLIALYLRTIKQVKDKDLVYEQTGQKYYDIAWMKATILLRFENCSFPVVDHYHEWLTRTYGDYMVLPPKEERENRHQIYLLDFGE